MVMMVLQYMDSHLVINKTIYVNKCFMYQCFISTIDHIEVCQVH